MVVAQTLSKASRSWPLVVLAGAIGFVAGFLVFLSFGPGWIVRLLADDSAVVAGTVIALPFALGGAAIAGLFATNRRRAQSRLLRAALNNMTQGLCMFDGTARLVLCNDRYLEMYALRPELSRAGTPLRELLRCRIAAGTFSGDPDRYVADCLRQVAEGRTETKTNHINGRVIMLVSRPMAGGGWVATHNDVTEQLSAETERDLLRQREDRRRVVDAAIVSFRARVESVLKTVEPKLDGDESRGEDAAPHLGSYAHAHRGRRARLQRGVGQCRDRGRRGHGTFGIDQGDQPAAHAGQRRGALRRGRCRRHQ